MNESASKRGHRVAHLKPDRAEVGFRISVRDDVHRLVAALEANGVMVTEEVAFAAWRRHSDSFEAVWTALYPDDDDNRRALLQYLDVED